MSKTFFPNLLRTGLGACRSEEKLFPVACQLPWLPANSSSLHTTTRRSMHSTDQRCNTAFRTRSINNVTCHRCYSSSFISSKSQPGNVSLGERIRSVMGMNSKARFPPHRMTLSGYGLMRSCAELIDYEKFFEEFDMPDTFNSWFLILELHVWLCMVRLATEGPEGRFVRNKLAEAMWSDVAERAKNLGGTSVSSRQEALQDMNGHFRASLLAYDEGLLSDDRVLAGALWRVFFEKRDVNPGSLADMVEYIRQQIKFLDEVDPETLLCSGLIKFLPLEDKVRTKMKSTPTMSSGTIKYT